jgi:hypothetical protein
MAPRKSKKAVAVPAIEEAPAPPVIEAPAEPRVFAWGAYRVYTLESKGVIKYGTRDITDKIVAEGAEPTAEELEKIAVNLGALALTRAGLTPRSKIRVRQAIAAAHAPLLAN